MSESIASLEAECQACGTPFVAGGYREEVYPGREKREGAPASIRVCNRCGLGVAYPMLMDEALKKLYEDQGAEYWNSKALRPLLPRQYPVPYGLATARWKLISEYLLSTENKGLRIADIGAGFGFFGVLASRGTRLPTLRYIAIEPDKSLHERILEMWKELGLKSSIEVLSNIENIGERVDVLVLSHVLEHVQDPLAFIKMALNHLKDGGMVFIDVPHSDQRFKSDVFPHLYFFTSESLSMMLGKSGLEILDIDVWGCDWRVSPLSSVNGNVCFRFLDKVIGAIRCCLPQAISVGYFSNRFGMARRSKEGTWLRALALKPR